MQMDTDSTQEEPAVDEEQQSRLGKDSELLGRSSASFQS